ncbi:MAG: hypothetical protein ACRCUE_13695 [Bosea sp. (in: a-proteobacteria)]
MTSVSEAVDQARGKFDNLPRNLRASILVSEIIFIRHFAAPVMLAPVYALLVMSAAIFTIRATAKRKADTVASAETQP